MAPKPAAIQEFSELLPPLKYDFDADGVCDGVAYNYVRGTDFDGTTENFIRAAHKYARGDTKRGIPPRNVKLEIHDGTADEVRISANAAKEREERNKKVVVKVRFTDLEPGEASNAAAEGASAEDMVSDTTPSPATAPAGA